MTTQLRWLSPLVLSALLLPGCDLSKPVGDEPAMAESGESGQGAGASESTTTTASAGGGGDAGGGFDFAACGVDPVPPGLPGFTYSYECEGDCGSVDMVVPLPLPDIEAVGECLCASAGCDSVAGEVGEGGGDGGGTPYEGVCDVEIVANDGPGDYAATCTCEVCDVHFEDIHPDSLDQFLIGDETLCNCLCLEAGCGYTNGGGEGGGDGGDGGG
ncbi:MAG: hypothetical protein JKY37_33365, partial [Nannocystaceae bacterium]|nr:hypothetical protein [Nannocystaceae bacterium]